MNFEAKDDSQKILRDEVKGRRIKQDKDHSANFTLNKENNNNNNKVTSQKYIQRDPVVSIQLQQTMITSRALESVGRNFEVCGASL